MITASCSGSAVPPCMASMASRAWLVTTRSDARATSRDFSTKQLPPCGQRCSAEALPDRDGHLLPAPLGVGRRVVPVGQAVVVELLLGPLAQGQHLGPEGRLRRGRRRDSSARPISSAAEISAPWSARPRRGP